MEPTTLFSLSVLVTKEEYADVCAWSKQKDRRALNLRLRIFGSLLFLLGLVGLFFGELLMVSVGTSVCLVLMGLFCIVFDSLIAPFLDRAEAAHEYEEKEDLHFSTIFTVQSDRLGIKNGRIEGQIPYSYFTNFEETSRFFFLRCTNEIKLVIPKRLLSEAQIASLHDTFPPYYTA